jgi:sulfite exporter TauE/SafE
MARETRGPQEVRKGRAGLTGQTMTFELGPVLALGFILGMRHATDADHVVAVSTIVSRERTLRAAAPIGILWGLGHTLTILLVGGAIISFGVVIPPRLGLAMEFSVAIMLLVLGGLNLRSLARRRSGLHERKGHAHPNPDDGQQGSQRRSVRPLLVGVVHGLAGSAAIALLVLGAIRDAPSALGYLVVFCLGTIAGMLLITLAMAMPMVATARRFARLHFGLAVVTGIASMIFGGVLVYRTGFVHGLFTAHPRWTPE